jgi:hypothetical protein
VAIQCLESAYDVSSSDVHLLPSKTLLDIYSSAVEGEPAKVSVSQEMSHLFRNFHSVEEDHKLNQSFICLSTYST